MLACSNPVASFLATATFTPEPISTLTPLPTSTPTPAYSFTLGDEVTVIGGAFAFRLITDLELEMDEGEFTLSKNDQEVLFTFSRSSASEFATDEEFAFSMADYMGQDIENMETSEIYSITVDGEEGVGLGYWGSLYGEEVSGELIVIYTDGGEIYFALGLSYGLTTWQDEGSEMFWAVMDTVRLLVK